MGKIYNDGYGGIIVGRVDSDGKIYNDASSGSIIGRIDNDGKVWNAGQSGTIIGRVDSNGKVWNDGYGGTIIGRVDSSGKVWNDASGGTAVGRIEGGKASEGAALLLFNFNAQEATTTAPRGENPGCLGMVFAIILLPLRSWGGRIGVVVGIVLGILSGSKGDSTPIANIILIAVMLGYVGGGIEKLINFFRSK